MNYHDIEAGYIYHGKHAPKAVPRPRVAIDVGVLYVKWRWWDGARLYGKVRTCTRQAYARWATQKLGLMPPKPPKQPKTVFIQNPPQPSPAGPEDFGGEDYPAAGPQPIGS